MTNLSGANLNNGAAVGPQGEDRDSPSTFPAYLAYKNSGDEWLSEVPEHWEVLPLKHFAEVDNSGCYGVEPADGEHIRPVATTAQIDSEGKFDVVRMSDRGFSAQELARYECSPGDVLIVKSSGSAENIISGKAGLVRSDTPAFVFSNFLMRLRHRKDVCLPSFLYSLLISHLTRERIKQMCSTTTYPNLQVGLYTSAKLPCPPLNEQTQIARFLDHETARIDALIEEQQRLIELLKEKRQAVISHAVTKGLDPTVPMKDSGVEWLGEVPAHWVVGPLRWYATIQGGIAKGKDYEGRETVSLPYLRVANVQNGFVDLTEVKEISVLESEVGRYSLRSGDVLMNEGGDNDKLGRGTVWQGQIEPCLHQNHVFSIRPNDLLLAKWLAAFTQCDQARSYFFLNSKQSTNLASISASNVMSLALPIPSVAEQKEIISSLNQSRLAHEELVNLVTSTVEFLKERRSALISAAVTGKIDVRGWQPSIAKSTQHRKAVEA
jgi:type I restriction enzyme, S subunit